MESKMELLNQVLSVEEVTNKVMAKLGELPEDDRKKIITGDTYGMCGTFALHLRNVIENDLPVKTARAKHEDGNAHTYLMVPGNSPDDDIIIDPTANQFIRGLYTVFIGTRKTLRELVLNSKINNTRSRNNPQEAFDRTWGITSNIVY